MRGGEKRLPFLYWTSTSSRVSRLYLYENCTYISTWSDGRASSITYSCCETPSWAVFTLYQFSAWLIYTLSSSIMDWTKITTRNLRKLLNLGYLSRAFCCPCLPFASENITYSYKNVILTLWYFVLRKQRNLIFSSQSNSELILVIASSNDWKSLKYMRMLIGVLQKDKQKTLWKLYFLLPSVRV